MGDGKKKIEQDRKAQARAAILLDEGEELFEVDPNDGSLDLVARGVNAGKRSSLPAMIGTSTPQIGARELIRQSSGADSSSLPQLSPVLNARAVPGSKRPQVVSPSASRSGTSEWLHLPPSSPLSRRLHHLPSSPLSRQPHQHPLSRVFTAEAAQLDEFDPQAAFARLQKIIQEGEGGKNEDEKLKWIYPAGFGDASSELFSVKPISAEAEEFRELYSKLEASGNRQIQKFQQYYAIIDLLQNNYYKSLEILELKQQQSLDESSRAEREQRDKLQEGLREASRMLQREKDVTDSILNESEALQDEMASLEEQLDALKRSNEALAKDNLSVNRQKKASDEAAQRLQEEIESQNLQIKKLQASLREKDVMEQEMRKLIAQNSALQDLESDYEARIDSLVREHEARIAGFASTQELEREEFKRLELKSSFDQARISALEGELQNEKDKAEESRNQLARLQRSRPVSIVDSGGVSLADELAAAEELEVQAANHQSELRILELEQKLAEMRQKFETNTSALRDTSRHLKDAAEKLEYDVATLEELPVGCDVGQGLQTLRESAQNLSEHSGKVAKDVAALKARIAELESNSAIKDSELAKRDEKIKKAKDLARQLEDAEIGRRTAEASSSRSADDLKLLNQQLSESKARERQLQESLVSFNDLKAQLEEAKRALELEKAERRKDLQGVEELTRAQQALMEQNKLILQNLQAKEEELRLMQQRNVKKDEKLAEVNTENQRLVGQEASLRQQMSLLQNRVDDLERQLRAKDDELAGLRVRFEAAESSVIASKEAAAAAAGLKSAEDAAALNDLKANYKAKLEEWQVEKQGLQAEIARLKDESNNYRRVAENAKSEAAAANARNSAFLLRLNEASELSLMQQEEIRRLQDKLRQDEQSRQELLELNKLLRRVVESERERQRSSEYDSSSSKKARSDLFKAIAAVSQGFDNIVDERARATELKAAKKMQPEKRRSFFGGIFKRDSSAAQGGDDDLDLAALEGADDRFASQVQKLRELLSRAVAAKGAFDSPMVELPALEGAETDKKVSSADLVVSIAQSLQWLHEQLDLKNQMLAQRDAVMTGAARIDDKFLQENARLASLVEKQQEELAEMQAKLAIAEAATETSSKRRSSRPISTLTSSKRRSNRPISTLEEQSFKKALLEAGKIIFRHDESVKSGDDSKINATSAHVARVINNVLQEFDELPTGTSLFDFVNGVNITNKDGAVQTKQISYAALNNLLVFGMALAGKQKEFYENAKSLGVGRSSEGDRLDDAVELKKVDGKKNLRYLHKDYAEEKNRASLLQNTEYKAMLTVAINAVEEAIGGREEEFREFLSRQDESTRPSAKETGSKASPSTTFERRGSAAPLAQSTERGAGGGRGGRAAGDKDGQRKAVSRNRLPTVQDGFN